MMDGWKHVDEQDMPLVSVVVPVFNQELYLPKCLDSILAQSLRRIEIILIDDGSTDGSLAVMRSYGSKDSRIKIIVQDNKGVGVARNVGVACSEGEYVAFVDPDDWYPGTDVLKRLYEGAKKNDALACGGSLCVVDPQTGEITTSFDDLHDGQTFGSEELVKYEDYQFDFGFYRFIYSTAFLKENRIKFPAYCRFQDPPFMVCALASMGSFYSIPDVVYAYRFSDQPLSWSKERILALICGLKDNLDYSRKNNLGLLHELTVKRLEIEYEYAFADFVYDEEVFAALVDINSHVDASIMLNAGNEDGRFVGGRYLVKPLRNLFSNQMKLSRDLENATARASDLKNDFLEMRQSTSYKIGRAITFLPRIIKDLSASKGSIST